MAQNQSIGLFKDELLEKLNLAGVVEIMRGDAVDQPHRCGAAWRPWLFESRLRERNHNLAQLMVHVIEQRELGFPLPRQFGARGPSHRPFKKVGPGKRERSALLAREAAPDDVLPVGAVDHELPDIVAARLGPSRDVSHRQSAQAAPKIRAVPGLAVVRAIDDGEDDSGSR